MNFNNPNNRCTLTGYICSEYIENETNTTLELKIGIERKSEVTGAKKFADYFTVYVNKSQMIALLKTLAKKGSVITVKGEVRNWKDGSVKICADSIIVKA